MLASKALGLHARAKEIKQQHSHRFWKMMCLHLQKSTDAERNERTNKTGAMMQLFHLDNRCKTTFEGRFTYTHVRAIIQRNLFTHEILRHLSTCLPRQTLASDSCRGFGCFRCCKQPSCAQLRSCVVVPRILMAAVTIQSACRRTCHTAFIFTSFKSCGSLEGKGADNLARILYQQNFPDTPRAIWGARMAWRCS